MTSGIQRQQTYKVCDRFLIVDPCQAMLFLVSNAGFQWIQSHLVINALKELFIYKNKEHCLESTWIYCSSCTVTCGNDYLYRYFICANREKHIHYLRLYLASVGGHGSVTHQIFIAEAQIIYTWHRSCRVKTLSHDESGRSFFFPTEEEIFLQPWL